jgi:uncharacterized membrane protein
MSNMFSWLLKADKGADLLSRWSVVYLAMTAVFTWLAKNVPFFDTLNWAELIFLGIICSLVTIFVAAASLAMIRYFRPLSRPDRPAPEAGLEDLRDMSLSAARLIERVSLIEADVETAKDGEDSLRAAIQGFMKTPLKLAMEFNEKQTAEVEKLGNELHAIRVKQIAVEESCHRVEDLQRTDHAVLSNLGNAIERVYHSLAAIWHRERLLEFAQLLEKGGGELSAPTHGKEYLDQDAWEKWEAKERAWRSILESWCELAGAYIPGVRDDVMKTSDEHFKQKGVAKVEQFPDPEAFFAYKAFCAISKNWHAHIEPVMRIVHQVAFNSAYRSASMGDGGTIGPG